APSTTWRARSCTPRTSSTTRRRKTSPNGWPSASAPRSGPARCGRCRESAASVDDGSCQDRGRHRHEDPDAMLINCVAYQDGKKLADIRVEDISDYVGRPDCFVWVALRDATDDELTLMQHEFGLHELAVEDARHGHQRPKVEEYGETLFAVMHTVEFTATDQLHVGEVNMFVGRNF